jgi:hypothetical protein
MVTQTEVDIQPEINHLALLVDEGGYIGLCDHRVPPEVLYRNHFFYLVEVRVIWGKGVG